MTEQLRALLHDAAAAVPDYADADRALRAGRRALRRRAVSTAIAAAVVVVIAVGAASALRSDPRGGTDEAGPVAPGGEPVYPAVLAPPERAAVLPASRVGSAALVYAPCARDCDPFLVLDSGRQYRLPRLGSGTPTAGYTLSPDGRWLGWPTESGLRIRDLDGRGTRDIADDGPGRTSAWAWSADSRWILAVRHTDGLAHHATAIDVTTGARHRADVSGYPVGVRIDGRLVAWVGDLASAAEPAAALDTVDLSTGASERTALDLGPALRTGEIATGEELQPVPGGSLAMLPVQAATPTDILGPASAVLVVDLDTGRVVRRVDLPPSDRSQNTQHWEPRSYEAGGITLVHWTLERTEIVQLDPDTGATVVHSTLPRDSQVLLRGTRR
jgi:hypothetical protein